MPARKKPRRVRLIVITLALVLVVGIGYGSYWSVSTVRSSFPQTTGSLRLKGLSAPVDVKRDANGIPQIYADTPEDLFRAQGYVQAQDRFYEMDVRRHLTSGRLSEMFGKSQVETDAFLRTLNWHGIAQQEWDTKLDPATKAYLQAYTDGVNAYLKDHSGAALSLEYAALSFANNYKPQPWTPVDSVAWLKAMAWDLRGNMEDEIDRALMTSRLSQTQIKQLYPAYPYDRNLPIIVDPGTVDQATEQYEQADGSEPQGLNGTVDAQLSGISQIIDQMPALLGPSGSGIGSNSWVVAGKYTTTGKPLLANDPHLAPQLPSLWYQMGLHCRTVSAACPYDVAGYTFSGMPGVIIGHNQNIAWGMTNLGADVTDLYLEKVTANTYLYDGKQVPFTTRKETIKVAGGQDRTITVRETKNDGPIISDRSDEIRDVGQAAPVTDPPGGVNSGYAVALKWTALTPSKTMDAVFELDKATDFKSFQAGAADFAVPSQNLIYADTRGNIGYQAPGQVPIRSQGDDGTYPVPGWDSRYKWTGYIPFTAMPYEYNPPRGYIVTANQAVIDQSKYPYLLTEDWGYGTRSQRINSLIASKTKDNGKISMDDMQSMQNDDSSEIARLLVPYLQNIDIKGDKGDYVRQAQQLLDGWDYKQDSDSAAAAYFNAVWRNILKLAFGNKLPKELRPKGQCLRVLPVGETGPVDNLDGKDPAVQECGERDAAEAQPDGGDRWFEVVRDILNKPDSPWWTMSTTAFFSGDPDKAHHSTRDQLLAQAMKDARYELTAKLGKDIDTWSWGRLHKLDLKNQTLGTDGPGVIQWVFNRGPWQLSGGEAAVDATGWNAAGGYDVDWVPSMRMIVNLQDFDKSRWINLTGASGHAYNSHYTDQTDKWAAGELLPWYFSDTQVDLASKAKMALTP
ncbi:penicillin acylase family protein [Actinacidiphila sp. ITFR-21]|uniref:penicillin acylase family protein n=1 Tax=Actinacidiphila sp. ITFR-21 TaxID=3075199 RepID=UPI00288A555A|nr:penicillin acylase family protein [Streptomyces sp. ITFR-21]WNI15892.1 penicillin acylase family protein [Streptomyces sp. ITFR-21]